jgi:hypothetical protein
MVLLPDVQHYQRLLLDEGRSAQLPKLSEVARHWIASEWHDQNANLSRELK